jgi:hypothetical protein
MPQWKVTLATTKKNPKNSLHFQQGQIMTLAAASVISKRIKSNAQKMQKHIILLPLES